MSALTNHSIAAHSGVLVIEKDAEAEVKRLEHEAITEENRARQITVETDDECDQASAEMIRLKTLIKAAQERFDPIVEAANRAHKEACKQRSIVIEPLQRAINILSPKVAGFLQQKRQAEEAERQRQLEAARAAAEAEREREIEQAEAQGCSDDEVQALCDMPLAIAPVVRTPAARVARPVSARSSYRAIVKNKLALVQHVAKNPQLLELLSVNEPALNGMARSLKTALSLPGVEVMNESTTVTRTVTGKA
jgi:hypothetical protein